MSVKSLEGIVLYKSILKGRNISAQLLLRNGQKVSILFYGGIGGGKKGKGGIVELGQMLNVTLKEKKNNRNDVFEAKEWSLVWYSKLIRQNHNAFYLLCFFLEVTSLTSTQFTHLDDSENISTFNLLSNTIFYLDKSLEKEHFSKEFFLLTYLGRLLQTTGIFPDIEHCLYCQSESVKNVCSFEIENGGFVCDKCSSSVKNDFIIINLLNYSQKSLKEMYQNLEDSQFPFKNIEYSIKQIFNYFLYQFHIEQAKIKSSIFVL